MLEVLRELVDVVAALRGISGNRQAELHALLDECAAASAKPKTAPPAAKADPDVPAGA